MSRRLAIIGGPRTGKSTLAKELAAEMSAPILCTDPASLVKDPEPGVEYVPDTHGDWSRASEYVATQFLTRPGPWILDGVGVPRALRKYHEMNRAALPPVDRVIVMTRPFVPLLPGQVTMTKGLFTVLGSISLWLGAILEWR